MENTILTGGVPLSATYPDQPLAKQFISHNCLFFLYGNH